MPVRPEESGSTSPTGWSARLASDLSRKPEFMFPHSDNSVSQNNTFQKYQRVCVGWWVCDVWGGGSDLS